MSELHLIPARRITTEFTESKSRFIANAAPVFSVPEAQRFIASIKDKYADASHNVSAYMIGHGNSVLEHCSDDGEPSGTAGRPALAVLKGSGLGDIVIVVTRYFGGIKLGTGGLVRAYSNSVRHLLNALPQARKVSTTILMFVVPYALFEQSKVLINCYLGQVRDEAFGADITLTVRLPDEYLADFKGKMIELTRGNIEFITISQCSNSILPLN